MALKNTPTHTRKTNPTKCKYRRIWDDLDEEDKTVLEEWLNMGLGYRSVRTGLREDGHEIGEMAVSHHMSAACSCDPDQDHDPAYGITGRRTGSED